MDALAALRGAFPSLTWRARRRGEYTYITGSNPRRFVTVRVRAGTLSRATLYLDNVGVRVDYAYDPVATVRRVAAVWHTDATAACAAVTAWLPLPG